MSELNVPNFDKAWTRLQVWFATDAETTSSLSTPKLLYLNSVLSFKQLMLPNVSCSMILLQAHFTSHPLIY